MKKLITFATVLLALIFVTSCKKSSNNTSPYNMKASIGSFSFDAEGLTNVNAASSSSGGIHLFYFYGTATDGKVIKMTLIPTDTILSAGTYSLDASTASADYFAYGIDSTYTYAVSGTVTLTAISPNYIGGFNFICADSTHITNGSFTIKAL